METVLITGCSSGIGAAAARAFLDDEWQVYATARDPSDLDALATVGCETAPLDVTDGEQISTVVERIEDETGRIDCLVNNAGYGQFGALEDVTTDRMAAQFDVNVFGPHRLARAVLPYMRAADDGTIVNVTSTVTSFVTPGSGAYAGSKAALSAMSDALRAEVAGHGVDVVEVVPGPVETAFRDRATDAADDLPRTDAYAGVYGLLDDWEALGGGVGSIPPETVAATILNAASCTDPAPRYPVGPVARLARFAGFVPRSLRDRVFGLLMRLV